MEARTISQAAKELALLKRQELERLALAVGAALVAGTAAVLDVRLGLALGVGAAFEAVLALTSVAERRALVASLAVHREAYLLPEVQHYGEALATMESRRALARSIATLLRDASRSQPTIVLTDRVIEQTPALAALGRALIEPGNVVEPTAVAACTQLLTDGRLSPLLNPALSQADLDRALGHIHAGISHRGRREAGTADPPRAA